MRNEKLLFIICIIVFALLISILCNQYYKLSDENNIFVDNISYALVLLCDNYSWTFDSYSKEIKYYLNTKNATNLNAYQRGLADTLNPNPLSGIVQMQYEELDNELVYILTTGCHSILFPDVTLIEQMPTEKLEELSNAYSHLQKCFSRNEPYSIGHAIQYRNFNGDEYQNTLSRTKYLIDNINELVNEK